MALRIRKNGDILCAALHPPKKGDIYLDDGEHYRLSVEMEVICTDEEHMQHGYWWWCCPLIKQFGRTLGK